MATDPTSLFASMLSAPERIGDDVQRNRQIGIQQQQVDQQGTLIAAKAAEEQRKQLQDQAYQQDVSAYFADPRPQNLARLAAKYPEQAEGLQKSYQIMDTDAKRSRVTQYSSLYNAAKNGRTDLVKSQLTAIRAAEKAQGIDTKDVDDAIAGLDTPGGLTNIIGLSQVHLAAADPEFAKSIGLDKAQDDGSYTLSPGAKRFDRNNNLVASAPTSPEYRTVSVYDDNGRKVGEQVVPFGGGGDPASSGGAPGGAYSRANIRGAESAGDDNARNSHGTAVGRYQITTPTALSVLAQNASAFPEVHGKGAAERAAFARRPDVQERIMDVLEPQYKAALSKAGLPVTGTTMYMTHFLGTGTAPKFMQMAPGMDARAAIQQLDPKNAAKIISGNGAIFAAGATVGSVIGEIGKRYARASGGGSGGDGFSRASPGSSGGSAIYQTPIVSSGGGDDTGLTGEAYLKTLPPGKQAAVRAVAEGRAAAPRPGSRNGEALLDAVTRYDPTFDAANATTRAKTRVDFTSGKSAMAVNSLNTAMGHLLHLDTQAAKLGNFETMPGWINPLYNKGREAAGNTDLPAFNQTKQAASSEMRKVFAGAGGGNLAELEEWQSSLSSSMSYPQLHAAIANGVKLMASRLDALKDQYSQGMNRSDVTPQFVKPSLAQSAKRVFGVDLGAGDVPHGAAPVRVKSLQQARALKPGTMFIDPYGVTRRR